ncbi:MAG: hypothetical protein MUC88_23235 [Planctomycetes bacterium]|jgi:hypothetical protein|nr:hypothetical protein [Planctomycetota bacterium]
MTREVRDLQQVLRLGASADLAGLLDASVDLLELAERICCPGVLAFPEARRQFADAAVVARWHLERARAAAGPSELQTLSILGTISGGTP